jgi:hypothetical protein
MKIWIISIKILLSFLLTLLTIPSVQAIDAVASMGKLTGDVEVIRKVKGKKKDMEKIYGRTGLILNDKDVIITGPKARVTIIFRDGSEVRIFQNTRFVIEKSDESRGGKRMFFHNFKLSLGAFWGKFIKGDQHTIIKTPTATIGIKGTSVSLAENKGVFDLSLFSGRVEIENDQEKFILKPGQMIKGLVWSDSIKDKVQDLPYRLVIKPDQVHIKIPPKGETETIYLTMQIVESETKKNVFRSGSVYLSLDTNKILFEKNVTLNKRGYARVKAVINPFQKDDYGKGQIKITAIMDGSEFLVVGSGQTILMYDIPPQISKTIRIDADSGEVGE